MEDPQIPFKRTLLSCETYGRQMKSVVEDVTRNAPAGSEATMTALDSAIAAANTLYETLQSSGQQAVEVTRSNLEIASAAAKVPGEQSIRYRSP